MAFTFSFFRNFGLTLAQKPSLFAKQSSSSTMPADNNSTLFCLIFKCRNASSLKIYRPIGLYNTSYKTVTKIIVNRIKPILHTIISPTQANFLANRNASDHAIIIQEFITHFRKMKGKEVNMILKIDLEKAFDKLEWSFIKDTLPFFEFSPNLINLILSCVTSSFIAVLVNGRRTPFFNPSRGIR